MMNARADAIAPSILVVPTYNSTAHICVSLADMSTGPDLNTSPSLSSTGGYSRDPMLILWGGGFLMSEVPL